MEIKDSDSLKNTQEPVTEAEQRQIYLYKCALREYKKEKWIKFRTGIKAWLVKHFLHIVTAVSFSISLSRLLENDTYSFYISAGAGVLIVLVVSILKKESG